MVCILANFVLFFHCLVSMKYLNALNKIPGVGSQKMRTLFNFFGSGEEIWKSNLAGLRASGMNDKLAETILYEKERIDPDKEWEKLEKENIRMISQNDEEYPQLLKEIFNPPFLLYAKGSYDLNSRPMVSIVGSRKHTPYGEQVALSFANDLAQAGVTVVSGMALGIDALAHQGAMAGGGKTVAVLGSSLDDKNIYPKTNFALSREIAENGILISEFPVETPVGVGTFPMRNRIIAGLSLGTLVVEAGEKSGTLITSSLALEYNREVFTVPGSIFSAQSLGTNSLAKRGAKIVTSVKDILEELDLGEEKDLEKNIPMKFDTQEEEIIFAALSNDPTHIDIISKISRLGAATVASTLMMMEIKGWIKNIGGQNYIKY